MRVLITEPLADEGIRKLSSEHEVDVFLELEPEKLLDLVPDYDAVIVRSATMIDREVLERGSRLKVVGRAGIGLDNIDVATATRRGILVVNAPQSNVLSAAEHTMALMLAMARNIPSADASLRSGRWERNRFTGVELHGKTLGIVGMGRIGTLVAQRAAAFGMRLVAYDPYVSHSKAAQLGIHLVSDLEELCRASDFITVHLPKTPETKGLVGEKAFAAMKPGVRIVNASRGGIVDEAALLKAYEHGTVAGAAFDVFEKEPPGEHPFFRHSAFVVTPHLGASTQEAQEKAGMTIADQVLLALRGEFAPYAVNIQGGAEYSEALRPFIPLTEKLGRILNAVAGPRITEVHFEFMGSVSEHDTRILTLAGLKGLFSAVVHEPVTYVNAPLFADERGIEIKETKSAVSMDYVNLISVRAGSDQGTVTVAGSLVGKREQERIVQIYDYAIDMPPERHMCFLRYRDVPGVIGKVGTVLGDSGVNIASMQVSRETIGGEALMGLTLDDEVPPDVLERIVKVIHARDAKFIDLGPGA
ncbi:MAG: phosphoglycerate dehydrogenase [Actinomycetota bacterium]|nr:phosphoglycerate dehydrogenase [Actinomycetota bacterium]